MVSGPDYPHIAGDERPVGVFPGILILCSHPVVESPVEIAPGVVVIIEPVQDAGFEERDADKPVGIVSLRAHCGIEPFRMAFRAGKSVCRKDVGAGIIHILCVHKGGLDGLQHADVRSHFLHYGGQHIVCAGDSVVGFVGKGLDIYVLPGPSIRKGMGLKHFPQAVKITFKVVFDGSGIVLREFHIDKFRISVSIYIKASVIGQPVAAHSDCGLAFCRHYVMTLELP